MLNLWDTHSNHFLKASILFIETWDFVHNDISNTWSSKLTKYPIIIYFALIYEKLYCLKNGKAAQKMVFLNNFTWRKYMKRIIVNYASVHSAYEYGDHPGITEWKYISF